MEPPANAPLEGSPPPARAPILLVDDQPANLLALEAILDPLGEEPIRAASGEKALQFLAERDFAVVLLDVQMPTLDGFETAKIIRGRPRSARTPIIFLTAHEQDRFPFIEAYKLGAVDYLVKPVVPEVLCAKVAVFVELFRQTQLAREQVEELRARDRRDIERERMARALQESEQRLRESEGRHRQLADNLPAGFIYQILHQEGKPPRFTYVSGGVEALLGVSPAAVTDNSLALHGQIVPEDAPRVRATEMEAVRDMKPFDCEFRVITRRGESRWLRCRSAPRALSEGESIWDGIAVDITDRMLALEELREANTRKDDFLAMLAHELRNPLAPIRNALHVLRLSDQDWATVDKVRAIMDRQLVHLTRIVDDLLDVSRVTRGKVTLKKETIDLAHVVRVNVEDHRAAFSARKIALSVHAPETPVPIHADPTRLAQIVDNLLSNALKFTNEGGAVACHVRWKEKQAELRVSDNGVGIDPYLLTRLFDPFTQADKSLARTQGGLGLGLAIVKGLVELHGGRIVVESQGPGTGASFTVTLPLAEG